MAEKQKPIHFLILKIVGVLVVAGGVTMLIIGFSSFVIPLFLAGGFCMVFGIPCLAFGFMPQIAKIKTKSAKYIQEENKEDLTSISSTAADIHSSAVTKTVKAVKEGLKDDIKYCKHCGAAIDADSKFCSKCGGEQ